VPSNFETEPKAHVDPAGKNNIMTSSELRIKIIEKLEDLYIRSGYFSLTHVEELLLKYIHKLNRDPWCQQH